MVVNSTLEKSLTIPTTPIWRLSVEQYHQMIAAGILTDDDPIELLEGWLVTKMPKNPPHSLATQLTRDVLAPLLPEGWFINVQEPVTLSDSEPEPDIAVIRGSRRDYAEQHPTPEHIALVIEVADATLQRDRGLKRRLYARAGIPVYWILNLPSEQLEVYGDPSGEDDAADYRQQKIYAASDTVPLIIQGQAIAQVSVQALFG